MRQRKKRKNVKITRVDTILTLAVVVLLLAVNSPKSPAETAKKTATPAKHTPITETAVIGKTVDVVGETVDVVGETVDETAEAPEPEEVEQPAPELNEAEVEMLACVIYQEAGGNECSDLARYMVGDVVLNRVDDPRFPDTLLEVLTQKQQYGTFYWTGVIWPERAQYETEAEAVARAYDTARRLLSGEHSEIYGEGYIWQAEFSQGTDVIYLDGIYFGR